MEQSPAQEKSGKELVFERRKRNYTEGVEEILPLLKPEDTESLPSAETAMGDFAVAGKSIFDLQSKYAGTSKLFKLLEALKDDLENLRNAYHD